MRFFLGILIVIIGLGQVAGQNPPIYYLDSIQPYVILDSCWVYHQGDSTIWAEAGYDDSHWISFNPSINYVNSIPEDFQGKAWFRLHLTLDSSLLDKNVSFRIEHVGASEIYINGVFIQRLGKMGNDTIKEKGLNPRLAPIRYHTSKNPDHVIAVRYHNSDPRNWLKLYGSPDAGFLLDVTTLDRSFLSLKWSARYRSVYTFLVSVLIVLGSLHFLLFLFYKRNKSNLLYSLFCILLSSQVIPFIVEVAPVFSPMLSAVVRFASNALLPSFLLTFVGLTYSFFHKKTSKYFWVLAGIAIISTLSLIINLQQPVVILYSVMLVLTLVEVLRVLFLAYRKKKDGVRILGMGIGLFLLFMISALIYLLAISQVEFKEDDYQVLIFRLLLVMGILSIPFSMSVFLARDFAKTNRDLSRQLLEVKRLSSLSLKQEEEKREILGQQKKKLEILVKKRTKELEKEKDLTEKLLHNTLPSKVADELKATGKAKPEIFENVTVFFSDIIEFTRKSNGLEPSLLIEELNDLFTAFDDIMISHNCERIKTIGDAYLAVSGMPAPDVNHAENMAKASLDIINFLWERNRNSDVIWEIRVGIHTGKLVGGIVGTRKYIYDIFGDSINTAARMEQNSEAMKINVSEITYHLLKGDYVFEKRLPKDIKGKGLMNMYYLIEEKSS